MGNYQPGILLVDDRPDNLLSLEVLLEEFDARLIRASSGSQALERLQGDKHIALVLLDVQMPDMDGFEVARLINEDPARPPVPIILITANSQDSDYISRGYRSGAVDFLGKPIEPLVLKSKVRIFLDLDRKSRELETTNQALAASLAEHKRLREQNEVLLRSVGEGILSLDTEGRIQYANPVADVLLDYGEILTETRFQECIVGKEGNQVIAEMISACREGRHWSGMVAARRYDHSFPAELTATPHTDAESGFLGVSLVIKDVSHWQLREQELRDESERDALTGLLNRRGLDRILRDRLCRDQPELALLFLDLDRFKPVNDLHGHQTGDALLRQIARLLQTCTRDSDVVARIGGDEFCVLLQTHSPAKVAEMVSEKLLSELARPIQLGGQAFTIGASIGIVTPQSSTSAADLLHRADMAMYAAKTRGRNTWCHYHPDMENVVAMAR